MTFVLYMVQVTFSRNLRLYVVVYLSHLLRNKCTPIVAFTLSKKESVCESLQGEF